MKQAKIALFVICTSIAIGVMNSAYAGTIFSCDLSNKHTVTIDSSNQEGTAYYYGSIGSDKSDLVLDSKTASFGNYMGPSWEYKYFRFAKGDYSYVVYNYDDKTKGLAVYKNKKLLMNKKCASNVEYDENGYVAASNQIKHDSEDDAFSFMPDDTSPPTGESVPQGRGQTQSPSDGSIPFKLTTREKEVTLGELGSKYKIFTIVSLNKNLKIFDFIIDDNQCVNFNIKQPIAIGFGQSYDFKYSNAGLVWSGGNWNEIENKLSHCPDIKLFVKTNMGDYTFNGQ